jgi:predicted AAA+ superfamily ATPase
MISKSEISQIIADQRSLSFKPNDLPRLSKSYADNEIVVISGVRRCGKSTLLHEIRSKNTENDYYFNFDDERLINFKLDSFQLLYEVYLEHFGKQSIFYFDEIQNVNGWERFVRRLYDYKNKVYITGSNASMLSRELGTHLTGRYYQLELFPFSFPEFLKYTGYSASKPDFLNTEQKALLHSKFIHYFTKGGFPAFLQSGNSQYLKSLYESVLYRDVMVRNSLTNEKEILELVHYIAGNTSKLFSYNSLSKVIGVKNATTVKNYLSFLESSYLLFLVNKYDFSVKKQIQNPKKIYFIDLGLVRELGFHHSEDKGRLLENMVFIELKRRGKDIYYHSQKHECDFLIKEKNTITDAIQVCWSLHNQNTSEREVDGLVEALEYYNLKEGLILTDDEEDEFVIKNLKIIVMPTWKWLLNHNE